MNGRRVYIMVCIWGRVGAEVPTKKKKQQNNKTKQQQQQQTPTIEGSLIIHE